MVTSLKKYSKNFKLSTLIWGMFILISLISILSLLIFDLLLYDPMYNLFKKRELYNCATYIESLLSDGIDDNFEKEVERYSITENISVALFSINDDITIYFNPDGLDNLEFFANNVLNSKKLLHS